MMRRFICNASFLLCLLPAVSVEAQNVIPTKMVGQPLMYMKEGEVEGCGMRIIGGRPTAKADEWEWFDVSINVYSNGGGLVKIVSYDINAPKMQATGAKPKPLKVRSGWLKAPGKSGTTPIDGKSAVADDGVSLLYGTDLDRTMPMFQAYFQNETISVAVRRASQPTETVYSGVIEMDAAEDKQIRGCLSELVSKWPK
ncbi:MAG: hypothetical protein U1F41_05775 [Burkholderiales bacterium]